MKTFKDIYKFPLKNSSSWIYDSAGNFVFQFEPRWNDKGDWQEGWQDFEKKIVNVLNGKSTMGNGKKYSIAKGCIFEDGDTKPIITIRGWGNLTGTGAHNLPAEEAANIQDSFGNFIVERLNT